MSMIAALAQTLDARITPAAAGASLTFARDGQWHTLRVREMPHLELSLPAPDLALHLWMQLGAATVRGDERPAPDGLWRMRSSDRALTAALLDEAPWPCAAPPDGRSLRRVVGGALARLNPYRVVTFFASSDTDYLPHFILELEGGVATLERRAKAHDLASSTGMAQRLIQLATWPARTLARAHATAAALGGTCDGTTPITLAIHLERAAVAVRIDIVRARRHLRTRITARGDREVTRYVERLELSPDVLAPLVDRAVAEARTTRSTGPYR